MSTDTSGPAFPVDELSQYAGDSRVAAQHFGLTVRDYFAAKALQGLLAHDNRDPSRVAVQAYQYADEMLKERTQ